MASPDDKRNARRVGGITRTVNAGLAHHRAGRLDRAAVLYGKALEKDPDRAEALHLLGVVTYQRGQFASAIALIERALPELADLPEAHLDLGNALRAAGRPAEAADSYRRAIALVPDYGMAHSNLAGALNDQGLFAAGLESSRRGAALLPDFPAVHINCAAALLGLERFAEAEATLRRTLELMPERAETHRDLGGVLTTLGRLDEAVASYRRAVELKPDFVEAHHNLGTTLAALGRSEEAAESYQRTVALRPDIAEAHYNLGNALRAQNRLEDAVASHRRAVELKPDFIEAHHNLGAALADMGKLGEAVASYQRALALAPGLARAHNNLGDALQAQNRLDDAVASYQRAIVLDPDDSGAYHNLGNALETRGRVGAAVAAVERTLALDPENPVALTAWFRRRQRICDWEDYQQDEAKARNGICRHPFPGIFALLAFYSTPAEQFDCARGLAATITVTEAEKLPRPEPRPGERIRLGYLSADFRQHPVGVSIAGLIDQHDRRHFEVIGYSCGPNDGSALRTRLAGAFDRFVDIGEMGHRQAAELIHRDGIDILIDLTGHTAFSRPVIVAYRPAPIQVNYLGYPGTMGGDFIDYIIVDRFVVPPDQQPFFTERLVHLPDCYQCSDDKREIGELTLSRAECGLPDDGFVFCCFNSSYKITPAFFDIWMQLLNAVPGSVLWLVATDALLKDNLLREAIERGVAAERLVFAPGAPMPEYLARLRLADLFLDTLPYNAGATANDALWAGLPVLTCAGETYVGRMAGALLTAVGLPELITTSPEAYADLALRLATEPGRLAALRQKLARNRSAMPLFDIARFTRNLEAAYRQMWETWRAGRPLAAFSVSPLVDAA
jgi:predicted O-linked N-acetylglucosamine transferase (SPINDLY family)